MRILKAKREHRVSVLRAGPEILDVGRVPGDSNPLVFSMRSGRPISASTLPKMLQHRRNDGRGARLPVVVPLTMVIISPASWVGPRYGRTRAVDVGGTGPPRRRTTPVSWLRRRWRTPSRTR